jgi:Holliday junction DNA helicase RuvA
VREDQLALYGFTSAEERALFLQLLGVNGIGPRVALTLLSSAPHEEFLRALQAGDEAYLVKLPGVGKKTAARLVVELQGKLPLRPAAALASSGDPLAEEAILALVSLGLSPRVAKEAVDAATGGGRLTGARVEDIVKAALRSGSQASE